MLGDTGFAVEAVTRALFVAALATGHPLRRPNRPALVDLDAQARISRA